MERQDHRVTIRNPATANLLIDSSDRSGGNSANFSITRTNSILNGFFTRMAVSEVVLQWSVPNIITGFNDVFTVITPNSAGTQVSITLQQGFYTMKDLLDTIVAGITAAGTGIPFVLTLIDIAGAKAFKSTSNFVVLGTTLALQMNFSSDPIALPAGGGYYLPITKPVVIPYNYIDFVCNDLTYNQSLKDASTNPVVRDILYRWNFAWEEAPMIDEYGYPIYQGYTPFIARRNITFPKQIRWENNMVLGNLSFQIYGYNPIVNSVYSTPLPVAVVKDYAMEWSMNLLVSED